MALFVDPGRQKPNASREIVSERYELCEDMATMLTESSRTMLFSLGIAEHDVVERVYRGLTGEDAVFTLRKRSGLCTEWPSCWAGICQ